MEQTMLGLPKLDETQFAQFEELVQDKLGFQMNAPQRNIMRTIAELEPAVTDSGNVMVQAAPGAGKTSLIVVLNIMIEMMKTLGLIRDYPRILALAHMRQNRAMLERYLPPYVDKMTVHKLGWSLCQKMSSRYTIAEWKVPNITHAILKKHYPMGVMLLDEDNSLNRRDNGELYWALARFIKILITSLVDDTNIAGIEWLYEQYTPDIAGITETFRDAIIRKLAPEILQAVDANRKEGGYLSFEEQVVVPIRAKWFNHQYDIVLVDEGQDLSPAQQIIVERVAKYKFVVGDMNQAIMAFGGADRAAWNRMSFILDATVLTMPISQRCPVKVIEYLQAVFKEVTPREKAPQGDVQILEDDETFVKYADKPGTGVICRTHADVAEAYVSLMHADVKTPIVVLGSDVYGMVKQTIQGMGRIRSIPQPFTNETFQEYLNMWLSAELDKARQQRMQAQRDIKISEAKQAARTVSLLFNFFQPDTPQQLTELVGLRFGTSPDDIFHKQKLFKTSLVVGTCHMWKGLEIPHAIVYNTFNYGQERGAASQENEVLFVAMSRAQQTLAFYPEEPVKPVPVNYDVEYIAEQNNQIPYPGFDSRLFLRHIEFQAVDYGLGVWETVLEEITKERKQIGFVQGLIDSLKDRNN
jgi:hypothetical protein